MKRPFGRRADDARKDNRTGHEEQNALTEEKSRKERSHLKAKHIVLSVLVLITLFVGYVVYLNRNNILAAYTFYTTKKAGGDIQELQEDHDEKIKRILDNLTETKIRDLTEEEADMLRKGELTEEEAIELITGKAATVAEAKEIVKKRKTPDTSKKDSIIAQIYVLRSTYSGRIDALLSGAINEYNSLPDSQKTAGTKAAMVDSLIARGNALEGQCDSQMEGLLAKLQDELKRLGEDTSVISEIRAIYAQEKRLKKAALFDAYR